MKILESIVRQDAIYRRHSGCTFKPYPVSLDHVHMILSAATGSRASIYDQSMEFVVIQDKELLRRLSDKAEEFVNKEVHALMPGIYKEFDLNVFYNAGTLIIVYARGKGSLVTANCWLSAESMTLAAHDLGLRTCITGLAIPALNSSEWKTILGVSDDMNAVVPIIVGHPNKDRT